MNAVLTQLLATEGNELYLLPLMDYTNVGVDEELSFFDLSARARRHREILLGWHLDGMLRPQLNPPDKHVRRKGWTETDRLIVLADYDWQ